MNINSVPPGSHSGVNAVTVEAPAPAPTAVTATNSVSDGVPVTSPPIAEMEPSATPALTPSESSSCGGSDARNGGLLSKQLSMASRLIPPGPQDSNSNPVSSPIPPAPVHSAPSPDAGAPPLSSFDAWFDAVISALEAEWLRCGSFDREHADCFIRNNATSFASRALDSMSANLVQASAPSSSDISNPSSFLVAGA